VIISVCLNPALDLTYRIGELRLGDSHQVTEVLARAGGKGVNVARVLWQLGSQVLLIAPAGGSIGAELTAELATDGPPAHWIPSGSATRRTVTISEPGRATAFNEVGGEMSAAVWLSLRESVGALVGRDDVVVLSGSLPPGCPTTAYRDLIELTRQAGGRSIVDAQGRELAEALTGRPDLAKPNAAEVSALLGRPARSRADVLAAGHRLLAGGALAAIISRGASGFVAVNEFGAWEVLVPTLTIGNPTGAGDALAAGLARTIAAGQQWPNGLAEAAALAVSAVSCPTAGMVDPLEAAAIQPAVVVSAFT